MIETTFTDAELQAEFERAAKAHDEGRGRALAPGGIFAIEPALVCWLINAYQAERFSAERWKAHAELQQRSAETANRKYNEAYEKLLEAHGLLTEALDPGDAVYNLPKAAYGLVERRAVDAFLSQEESVE